MGQYGLPVRITLSRTLPSLSFDVHFPLLESGNNTQIQMLVPFELVPQRLCAYSDEAEREYLTSTHPTTMLIHVVHCFLLSQECSKHLYLEISMDWEQQTN